MRKLTRNVLTAGAATVVALGVTSTPAWAATWTVSGGTSITGTNTTSLIAKDTATGATVNCSKSTASGTAVNGTGLSGTGLASLNSVAFSTPTNPNGWCSGPAGIVVQVTATGLPWKFNGTSYSAGVTTGTLTGVKATIHGSDECDATITGPSGGPGTISGTYTNSTGVLSVSGGNLRVATVDADCDPTLINAGDPITLSGKYKISPILTVTSP
ncbi:hypothetical protein [Actinomadura kijaniata]|uniref:hypothetical protein n=1 Tax=Actinomadura kijaniata TaxID=46161 RepID=UPI000830A689|nr:hypothetical protein [Actinomadura kijaniata]